MTLVFSSVTAAQTTQQQLSKAGIPSQLQKRFHARSGCYHILQIPDAYANTARQILHKERADDDLS